MYIYIEINTHVYLHIHIYIDTHELARWCQIFWPTCAYQEWSRDGGPAAVVWSRSFALWFWQSHCLRLRHDGGRGGGPGFGDGPWCGRCIPGHQRWLVTKCNKWCDLWFAVIHSLLWEFKNNGYVNHKSPWRTVGMQSHSTPSLFGVPIMFENRGNLRLNVPSPGHAWIPRGKAFYCPDLDEWTIFRGKLVICFFALKAMASWFLSHRSKNITFGELVGS